MASLALVRALSVNPPLPVQPHRVLSSSVIDRMKTIHEDQPLGPASPAPQRKGRGSTFTYGTTSEQYGYSPNSFKKSSERARLIAHYDLEENRVPDCCDKKTGHNILVAFVALMTVFSMVSQIVSIPLYMDAMSKHVSGSDAFVASFIAAMWQPIIFFALIFFFMYIQNPKNISVFLPMVHWSNVALAGVLGGLSTILAAFTSLPNRTMPGIQAILQQMSVPCTVITRFIVLRKGINWRQAVCIFTLAIGTFITLEPTIFGLTNIGPRASRDETNPHAWYYYVIYGFAQLPLAFSYALMEQGQKHTEVETMAYAAWYQLFLLFSYFLFVWIDFIPGFGMANANSSTYLEKLQNGFLCFYAADKTCATVAPLSVIYTLSTAGTTIFSILLIRFAEGAVFTVIVMTLATPLVTLFWTLFSADWALHWAPAIDLSAAFLLVGVAIMMPSVGMYAFFRDDTRQDADDAEEKRKQQEAIDAEKRKALQERARTARRHRRQYAVTYHGRQNSARFSQSEFVPRSKAKSSLPRVKSAPMMIGGF